MRGDDLAFDAQRGAIVIRPIGGPARFQTTIYGTGNVTAGE